MQWLIFLCVGGINKIFVGKIAQREFKHIKLAVRISTLNTTVKPDLIAVMDMGCCFLRQCWILAEMNSFLILAEMNSFRNTVYNSLYFELPAVPAYTEKGVNRAIFYISWLSKILPSNAFLQFLIKWIPIY